VRTDLQVGDKVLCLETFENDENARLFCKLPQPGWIYAVEKVAECEHHSIGVKLAGIKCRRHGRGRNWLFNSRAFRRIISSSERN